MLYVFHDRLAELLYIVHGKRAKEAFILATEVGGVLVTYTAGCVGGVEFLAESSPLSWLGRMALWIV